MAQGRGCLKRVAIPFVWGQCFQCGLGDPVWDSISSDVAIPFRWGNIVDRSSLLVSRAQPPTPRATPPNKSTNITIQFTIYELRATALPRNPLSTGSMLPIRKAVCPVCKAVFVSQSPLSGVSPSIRGKNITVAYPRPGVSIPFEWG